MLSFINGHFSHPTEMCLFKVYKVLQSFISDHKWLRLLMMTNFESTMVRCKVQRGARPCSSACSYCLPPTGQGVFTLKLHIDSQITQSHRLTAWFCLLFLTTTGPFIQGKRPNPFSLLAINGNNINPQERGGGEQGENRRNPHHRPRANRQEG